MSRQPILPGSGLMWGAATGLLAWTTLTLVRSVGSASAVEIARASFAWLVGSVLSFAVVGLGVGILDVARSGNGKASLSWPRALCGGGAAGVLGGFAFGKWMAQVGFFPLVASIVHSDSAMVGMTLHYGIAIVIGGTFGLLFQREIRGFGSSLMWGAAYGLLWWFLGPLTLLPLLVNHSLDWSASRASDLYGSLVGHLVYGLIVGFVYAVIDAMWRRVFYESDPLAREPEGAGTRALSSAGWGIAGSVIGGLAFSVVMLATGEFPMVASLAGGTSPWLGFAVHMAISVTIGATYGMFFRSESAGMTTALAWGVAYGLVWWFIGALTLFPILLGAPFTWTSGAAGAQFPSLVGHVLYGAATGLVVYFLQQRHAAWLELDPRLAHREERRKRPSGTAAPAVQLFLPATAIVVSVLLS